MKAYQKEIDDVTRMERQTINFQQNADEFVGTLREGENYYGVTSPKNFRHMLWHQKKFTKPLNLRNET